MDIEVLIQKGAGTIVDVRTPAEFRGGHAAGSVNIPVGELAQRMPEIKALKAPLILCCASGGRSAMAAMQLQQQGVACCDAGSWLSVNYLQTQNI